MIFCKQYNIAFDSFTTPEALCNFLVPVATLLLFSALFNHKKDGFFRVFVGQLPINPVIQSPILHSVLNKTVANKNAERFSKG